MNNLNGDGATVKLDPSKMKTMTCVNCSSFVFNATYVVKKVSALLSPTGKETIAPIQIFTCAKCNSILPLSGMENLVEDVESENTSEDKSNNIIL